MKNCFLIIIFVFLTLTGFTQKFNGIIKYGLSASQIDGDTYGGYHKIGGTIGFDVSYSLKSKLNFQTGIDYIGKGAANSKNQYYYRVRLNYVQVPILWNYLFSKNISVTGGLTVDYLIKGWSPSNPGDLELRNFAPSLYGSINYHISQKLIFNMGGAYSIINIKKRGDFWINNNLTLTFSRVF